MGLLEAIGKMFSGGSSDEAKPEGHSWKPEDWSIERIKNQGINPMVRNADEDYMAVETSYRSANCLARDVRH